ncbi:MAG: N-acetylmuramoyl-L-alanine amidase, partial [Chloroflexia bacterium]|nr:N-acetylmuramoyl-L-alanine amidase [Chloroflexia bacterium]
MRNAPGPISNQADEIEPAAPRERFGSAVRRAANRRVVMKAAAGVAALAASGIGVVPGVAPTLAQQADGTRARRYVPEENGVGSSEAAQGEWITFQAEFPFWALGASWPGDVGLWPVIAVQVSQDGETWTDTIDVAAQTDDGGQPSRDGRLFTALIFTDGAQWVRYQTIDIERVPGRVEGLEFTYIDPTDGPWEADIATGSSSRLSTLAVDTVAPPPIITRAQWGANENWRFGSSGEIWSPEYETVSHIIIHHTATANRPADVPNAIRSIYYYHAVEQGWGDIGYNYLVDHNGRIYQGRFGGQDVIGGHAYQFAVGSSGISTIGNFTSVDITEAAKSALVSICAFVGRDLDPLATADFLEAPDLPIIASHRDVNATSCPGDRLWNDLPEIRQLVAQTLDEGVLDTGLPAGIAPGDRVRVQTDDGSALNLRTTANGQVSGSLANDATAWVIDGPEQLADGNWYRVDPEGSSPTGWATAQFLIVTPPLPPGNPGVDLPFGLNVRFTGAANIRRSPGTTAGIVGTAATNGWAHILAGPVAAEGYTWYQVRAQNIGDGWVISDLIAAAPFNANPEGDFAVDDTVEATQTINLRPRPGIAQGVIATLGASSSLVISQPPVEVTGFIWYGVYSTSAGGGWVVQDYLRLRSSAPPSGKFQVNDTFRVTQTTNLRSSGSTSGGVVSTMTVGTTGTVIG